MGRGAVHSRRGATLLAALLCLAHGVPVASADSPTRRLVYGGDHDFPPFESLDAEGAPIGFNIDLIHAIGREAGYQITVELGRWSEIRHRLEVAGTVDVSDMYRSESRERTVEFTEPFAFTSDELFRRRNSPSRCAIDQLEGFTILAQKASSAEEYLRSLAPGIVIETAESEPEVLRQLAAGIGDCALVTSETSRFAVRRYHLSNLRTVGPPLNSRPYAFVVVSGRAELLADLNAGLARVRDSGEYERIHARWFNPPTAGLSTTVILRGAGLVLAVLGVLALAGFAWSWTLRRRVRAQTVKLRDELVERELVETALAASEGRFRTLVEHAPEAIAVIQVDGLRFTMVNDNAVLLFGRDREELYTVGPVAVSAPVQSSSGDPALYWSAQLAISAGERQPPFEWAFVDSRGQPIPCEVRLVRLPGEEQLVRASIVDISDRLLIDERRRLAQRMESVGRLAGGVTHDFNNLLTVISAHTSFLRANDLTPPAKKNSLDEINAAIERAAALSRQLLAFSRKQVLAPRNLDLNSIVADMYQLLSRLLGQGMELELDLDSDLYPIFGDVGQLEQVLMNLAINARDAMADGGQLRVETRNQAMDARQLAGTDLVAGEYVVLTVSDTGSGMDEVTRSRLFEPFFTTKPPGRGTGLGLATVYGIVRRSNGSVQVDSEPGQGATFRVLLPRSFGEILSIAHRGSEPAAAGKETVLLVEDEAPLRQVMRRTLEAYGYQVIAASSGDEALSRYRDLSGRIDMLLTDFVMPGMNGREVATRLRVERPELPVLFVSGYAEGAFSDDQPLPARTAIMPKPFRPEQLVHRVRELLDAES